MAHRSIVNAVLRWLSAHRFLSAAAVLGLAAGLAAPDRLQWVTRSLLGWNVAVVAYLLSTAALMLRADHERLRRLATAQAESATTVLVVVVIGAVASLVGIVVELATARQPGGGHAVSSILFALGTVAGAWLLLPTMFTLTYASAYYRDGHGTGLKFPDADTAFKPNYSDFLFSRLRLRWPHRPPTLRSRTRR